MPPEGWVEGTERSDCTPTKREVARVDVVKVACAWTKIECGTGEDVVNEVPLEARIFLEERTKMVDIVGVQMGCPGGESDCKPTIGTG